jgi:hypothetical protein
MLLFIYTHRMKKLITVFALAVLTALSYSTAALAQNGNQTAPPEEFNPSGAFSGQLFVDYYYVMSADTLPSIAGKGYYEPNNHTLTSAFDNTRYYQAFDIRRVYIGYDYNFSRTIAGQVLFSHENGYNNGDIVVDQNRGLYLKAANLRFKGWVPNAQVIVGQQGTAAFALSEQIWNYRSIEKAIMDFRGLAQSNDLGVQLAGTFDAEKNFGYSAMISNGIGAMEENDKYKKFAGELNAKFLDQHIILEVYGDYMDKPSIAKIKIGADSVLGQAQSNTTIKGFAAYTSDPVTIGIEYAAQTQRGQSNIVAGDDASVSALSMFVRGTLISKQLYAFARYDMYDPNTKASGSNVTNNNAISWKENFITAGLDWQPEAVANVHVIPNIWINTFKDKSSSHLDREGITVGRLTLSYKF